MDRKELKKEIVELCSTVKIELACTIREIMREYNVQKKELGWPVVINNSSYVDVVEVGSSDTDIPVFTISVGAGCYKEYHKVRAFDDCVSIELLADITTGLNNELGGYVGTYVAKYRFLYKDGTTADMDEPYIFLAESEKDAEDKACDYAEVWNNWNDDTIELVSVEKQVASKG
jgi:hypothetical protein|nr:MAG TPA: hypothetical protein [Caudoviricetes sp.]